MYTTTDSFSWKLDYFKIIAFVQYLAFVIAYNFFEERVMVAVEYILNHPQFTFEPVYVLVVFAAVPVFTSIIVTVVRIKQVRDKPQLAWSDEQLYIIDPKTSDPQHVFSIKDIDAIVSPWHEQYLIICKKTTDTTNAVGRINAKLEPQGYVVYLRDKHKTRLFLQTSLTEQNRPGIPLLGPVVWKLQSAEEHEENSPRQAM